MKNKIQPLLYLALVALAGGFISVFAKTGGEKQIPNQKVKSTSQDSTAKSRYPVAQVAPASANEYRQKNPIDLPNPKNVNTSVEFDPDTRNYIIRTRMGDVDIATPILLTEKEYMNQTFYQSLQSYYKSKNAEALSKGKDNLGFLNMKIGLGPADKLFGPGGIDIRTQGSAEIGVGIKRNVIDNPSLPERSRKRTYFDFDEKVQLNVNAKVGDKVNFNLNYDTEATFDFDSKKIKLQYQGKEDEIIKNIEAGNVSMPATGSLIKGSQALFGVKSTLQFGKLKATAILAQQESQSKTVNAKGGVQTTSFEIKIDQYDENRHFFLSHYFRDNYDKWMSKLPYISSGMVINRMEVWVTNKRGNYDQARNIIGFTDLGEHNTNDLSDKKWTPGSKEVPDNESNSLYKTIISWTDLREISKASQILEGQIVGGKDYEKIESARKLESSEYTYNSQLGYVSLKSALQPDEVLCVAYEYTMNGTVYQVGEFSSDNTTAGKTLYAKLLKNTSFSPDSKMWNLMMKNVYALNAYQIQKDKFRMDIVYQSDSTGNYVNYLPESKNGKQVLLKTMNLDRLDSKNENYPDGFFDYVEGYTVNSQTGRIYFPVVEPFGAHLAKQFADSTKASKYIFKELYDSTKTVAQQLAEKNKFLLKGEYKSSSGSEIRLNAMNVPRGSVKVTAGGATLTENVDYTVDYAMGVVTILNSNILESGTPVSVSLENQSTFSMQRKTLTGLNLNYEFNPNFTVGGTIMHLSEKPLTQKVNMGEESISNTIWGFNTSYRKQFQWLTDLVNKVPFINAKAPSYLTVNAEFAKLNPGHAKELGNQGTSYLDDFEATQTGYSLREYYPWTIASTPSEFAESKLSNDIIYGKNRALLAWYQIDGIFTRTSSSLMPAHIKADKEQRQNNFVREVTEQEIFPNKSRVYGETSIIPVLNVAYYPKERGPYNLDVNPTSYSSGINPDGTLRDPAKRWGGMMRKLDITDFESSNIEYIEFWMMDPFVNESDAQKGSDGELVFNLGEVSEDILKDGKKSFENGFTGDKSIVDSTNWGYISKRQSLTYAFDNTTGLRKLQDIGLDGLSTTEEKSFSTYASYLASLKGYLTDAAYEKINNDPAGDNYHYFRGSDFDKDKVSILNRYKRYNGTEGNSTASSDSPEKYDVAAKNVPDVEDINQDNTLNEYERYFEYRVQINHKDTTIGNNFITDKRVALVNNKPVTWYQFKIPVRDYNKAINNIKDFKTIRFMRMYLTGFQDSVILRFATLELIRGEWRAYTQTLNKQNAASSNGSLVLSAVNIEENANRKPVAYVLPPGISRVIDPSQPQLTQLNEQALSLKITDLGASDARAVYKGSGIDLRQYKRLQMYTHAEKIAEDDKTPKSGDLSVFIRLGSDYKNNYYEYEIPLTLTEWGEYLANSTKSRLEVWPVTNMFDFPLSVLTDTKTKRNTEKNRAGTNVTFITPYTLSDPDNPANKITVVGSPSLSDVKTIMIGVRNNSTNSKSAEIWVNELRVTGFNEDGGWALTGNANLAISDIASLNVSGLKQTAGFGSIEQSVSERLTEDYQQMNVAANVELGRLVPEKVKLKAPLFYSYSEQVTSPKYSATDQDLLLQNVLNTYNTQEKRDSIKDLSQTLVKVRSFSVSSLKFDIQSKKPMPYDPANFSVGYAYNESNKHNPTTAWEISRDYRGMFTYNYSPMLKAWEPFNKVKAKSLKVVKDFGINFLPNNFGFNTNITRNYYEMLSRDLNNPTTGKLEISDPLLSWKKDFLWDRQFSLRWDFTKQIKFNINAATNARIDEPNVPVNRRLFPERYEDWKDTVNMNLRKLGRPLTYSQTANLTWTLPLSKIGFLDWTTADVKYNSSYNWDRGAYIDANTEYGNTIRNQMQIGFDSRLNLEQLYNKFKFLKDANRKFSSMQQSQGMPRRNDVMAKKEFKQTISLRKDTTLTIYHNLNSRNVKVIARKADNSLYEVSYKVIDNNKIVINSRGALSLQLTVTPGPKMEDSPIYEIGQYIARGLMSVRNISIGYRRINAMSLPSFQPEVGAFFGQGREAGLMAPGLDFAFGLTDKSYIERANNKGWLLGVGNDSTKLVTPATYNINDELQIRANVEPIRGLKIELNATRNTNNNKQIQFMYEGMPEIFTGSFTMTTIAISTSLRSVNAKRGYQSDAFDQFVKNVQTITGRIEGKYQGVIYPNSGFNKDNMTYPTFYDSKYGGVNSSSADVLIPAFIAAYTGKDANNIELSAFPSLKSLLPNWRITYDGLSQLPFIKSALKALSLNHAYRCTYSVGSYSSFTNWIAGIGAGDDLGFIRDVLTGNPIPSSPFDISSVAITESYSPLIGVDATLKNNMSIHGEYKDSRNVALNISSNQIVESLADEFVVGLGYKIADFKIFESNEKSKSNFKNDLNLRGDISYRLNQALIRKIADNFTQPTSGTSNITVKLSADYAMSKALTLRAFLDKQINKPLVSSSSYPVSNTNFGISMKFTLTR
ncbi:MAG: cell surface protein SprA [Bacteroidota bacterium]|nr:cell surface protein SprA [Bacteroidota bacterium]